MIYPRAHMFTVNSPSDARLAGLHAAGFAVAVRCPSAEVAVPDRGCAHRIKLYLVDGEPLRCKGPKCPRFPGELRG